MSKLYVLSTLLIVVFSELYNNISLFHINSVISLERRFTRSFDSPNLLSSRYNLTMILPLVNVIPCI